MLLVGLFIVTTFLEGSLKIFIKNRCSPGEATQWLQSHPMRGRSRVQFLLRAHARAAGGRFASQLGCTAGSNWLFVSHITVPLSPPSSRSKISEHVLR